VDPAGGYVPTDRTCGVYSVACENAVIDGLIPTVFHSAAANGPHHQKARETVNARKAVIRLSQSSPVTIGRGASVWSSVV
jgi:hypothetical protein